MRATWFGAGVILLILSGCNSTQISGSVGSASSGGQGSAAATSGGQGTSAGTSGGHGTTAGTSGGQGSTTWTSGGQTDLCVGVSCAPGMVCDPSNGKCECYLGGPVCDPTQICASDGGCVQDPCFGLTCSATGASCFDGVCRCGGAGGVECDLPGESCSPIDNSCGPAGCAVAPCTLPNTVCSPIDDECHCGTTDGPVCGEQGCQLYLVDGGPLMPGEDAGGSAVFGLCTGGGDPCHGVVCPPFEACDVNNNGACECGGMPDENIPGVVCAADEACVDPFDGGKPTCLQSCQPFGVSCPTAQVPDASMIIDQGCYYFPASQATVCAAPTGDAGAGNSCLLPTDCAIPYTCGADVLDGGVSSSALVCLSYCDVFPDGGPTSTPPPDGGSEACAQGSVCIPLPPGIVSGTCEPE